MPVYELWGNESVNIDIDESVFPSDTDLCLVEDCFPDCQQHGWFESVYKKSQLHYRYFVPTTATIKGVMVFHHGIQGHSGRAVPGITVANTELMAKSYLENGYALYMLDALGHGFSEGKRFYVSDYKIHRDDFDLFGRFVASQYPSVPIFLSGESYGSCLCLHVAHLWQDSSDAPAKFAGITLMCPAIVGNLPPKPVVLLLRYLAAPLFPYWIPFFMPNPVSAENIWSDPQVRDYYVNNKYCKASIEAGGRAFRLGTASQMLRAIEDVRSIVIPNLKVPFCACHGKQDMAVPIASLDFLENHAATEKADRAVLRQDCYHDMLSEPTSQVTMDFILKFVNDRVIKVAS